METKEAMEHLAEAIKTDEGYRIGWQTNLACAAMDEGLEREAAHRAADRFLATAFGYRPEAAEKE